MKDRLSLCDSSVQEIKENHEWWRDLWGKIILQDCGDDSLDLEDKYGNTALILAAISDENEIVADLLIYGANPFHKNKSGKTALQIVLDQRMEIEYLIEHYQLEIQKERKMIIDDDVDPDEIFLGGLANSSATNLLPTSAYKGVINTLQKFEKLYRSAWNSFV